MELKKIDDITQKSLADFVADWNGESIVPASLSKYSGGFEALKEYLLNMETDPPRLMPPSTLWFLRDGDEILGAIEIKHFINSGLLRYGGHISFGVAPKHRGNNYAADTLKMASEKMKRLNLDMVLICCNDDNVACVKTIEKAGAVFESRTEIIRGGQKRTGLRYWLEV